MSPKDPADLSKDVPKIAPVNKPKLPPDFEQAYYMDVLRVFYRNQRDPVERAELTRRCIDIQGYLKRPIRNYRWDYFTEVTSKLGSYMDRAIIQFRKAYPSEDITTEDINMIIEQLFNKYNDKPAKAK